MPDSEKAQIKTTQSNPAHSNPAHSNPAHSNPAHSNPAQSRTAQSGKQAGRAHPVLRAALRKWWPLLVAVPAGAVAGGGYALAATPQYQANAYVMAVADSGTDSTTAVNFAQAYGRVVAQPEILAPAAATTGATVRQLTARIQAQTSPDAPVIEITDTAANAHQAAREANAVARSMVAFGDTTAKQTHIRLMTFATAAEPATPSSPSRSLDVAVGGAAGALLGSLALLARTGGTGGAERTGGTGGGPEELPGVGEAEEAAEAAPVPEQQRESAGAGA